MKTLIFLLLLLQITACGQTIEPLKGDIDPETYEAIKKSNEAAVLGDWIVSVNERQAVQLQFQGGKYRINIMEDDKVVASDEGSVDHFKPGQILLKSSVPTCAGRQNLSFRFEKIPGSVHIWLTGSRTNTRTIAYKLNKSIDDSVRSQKCVFGKERLDVNSIATPTLAPPSLPNDESAGKTT